MYIAKNNARAQLAGILLIGDLTANLAAGKGALFAVTAPDYTYATLFDGAGNIEHVKVTARATDALTIVRAQDGTAAREWLVGTYITCRPIAAALADFAVAPQIDGSGAAAIDDADSIGFVDASASNGLAKITWANVKATLKTYFDALYAALDGSATQVFSVAAATSANHAPRAAQIQGQALTKFTAGGTADALTGTLAPAITAYATGQRVTTTPVGANTATAPTLNLNAVADKKVFKRDASGSAVALAAGDYNASGPFDFEYSAALDSAAGGWFLLNPVSALLAGSTVGAARNLTASATGASATVTVTADEIAVESSGNAYQTLRSVNLSVDGTATGANGIDAGALAINTWYSVWVIWNGTTTAGLLSLSSSAPTLPSGYTHKARVGWIRTDGTANKYPLAFKQVGKRVAYKTTAGGNLTSPREIANGTLGTYPATYAASSVSSFVPPTAVEIEIDAFQTVNSAFGVAPSSAYSNVDSGSNPPPLAVSGGAYQHASGFMVLESTNIYAVSGSTCVVRCMGWVDS